MNTMSPVPRVLLLGEQRTLLFPRNMQTTVTFPRFQRHLYKEKQDEIGGQHDYPQATTAIRDGRVDLLTVQELGGWQTLSMVEGYAHLSPAHKAQAMEQIALLPNIGTQVNAVILYATAR